jgi:hypothetical protein
MKLPQEFEIDAPVYTPSGDLAEVAAVYLDRSPVEVLVRYATGVRALFPLIALRLAPTGPDAPVVNPRIGPGEFHN